MFFIFKQASLNLSWASPKVLKMGHLRPLFRTWSFTNKYYIFVTNYCQKLSIQSPVLGLETTTSPPINTRPGIPPILAQRVCLPSPVANQAQSIFNNSSLKFRFTFLIGCLKEQDRFRPIRMLQFWCQLNVVKVLLLVIWNFFVSASSHLNDPAVPSFFLIYGDPDSFERSILHCSCVAAPLD